MKESIIKWILIEERLPENGIIVKTKIDDERGIRNVANLRRHNNLWFFPDNSMYVYYTPTHWAERPNLTSQD